MALYAISITFQVQAKNDNAADNEAKHIQDLVVSEGLAIDSVVIDNELLEEEEEVEYEDEEDDE